MVGGTRKNRLATSAAAPRRISTYRAEIAPIESTTQSQASASRKSIVQSTRNPSAKMAMGKVTSAEAANWITAPLRRSMRAQ